VCIKGAHVNWRHWLGKGLFESALIVFSVLLALTVDNWRDTAGRHRRFVEARTHLVEELRFNRDLLATDPYLPHHRRLHAIYDGMENAGKVDQADAMFHSGVHVAPLREAAWRSFAGSDVSGDLPFADRALLEGVYDEQQTLHGYHQALTGAVITPRSDFEAPAFRRSLIRTIDLCLTDIVYSEQRLLKLYDHAISSLNSEAP